MTTGEILDLMLAKESEGVNPLPAWAAIDRVQDEIEDVKDVTDATYELFLAAAEHLRETLGEVPDSLPLDSNPAAYEAREALRIAWQIGRQIVSVVKGNYACRDLVVRFREALRNVPGLNVSGIEGCIVKMQYHSWADLAERVCRVLEEVEDAESEALVAAQPCRGK